MQEEIIRCSHCKTVFDKERDEYYKEATSNHYFCHFACQKTFRDAISLEARRSGGGGGRRSSGGGSRTNKRSYYSPPPRIGGRSNYSPSRSGRNSGYRTRSYPIGLGRMYNNYWGSRYGRRYGWGFGYRYFGIYTPLLPFFGLWYGLWYPKVWTPVYVPQSSSTNVLIINNDPYIRNDTIAMTLPQPIPFSYQLKRELKTIRYTSGSAVDSNNVNRVANAVNDELEQTRRAYGSSVPRGYTLVPDMDSQSFVWIKEGSQ